LHEQSLRREINEGLNVNEQWNGATDFVFFTRRGEMASNRPRMRLVTRLLVLPLRAVLAARLSRPITNIMDHTLARPSTAI